MRIVKKCKHCKTNFDIAQGEYLFFSRNDLHLPNLCMACRKKKREVAHVVNGKVLDGLEYERLQNETNESSS